MEDILHKKVELDKAEIHKHIEYDVSHLNFNKNMVHVKIKLSMLNIQSQEHIERLERSFQDELLKRAQEIVESYKIMCKESLSTQSRQ